MYPSVHSTLDFVHHEPSTTEIYTLSLHDALPISWSTTPTSVTFSSWPAWAFTTSRSPASKATKPPLWISASIRSEEHTSELQSQFHLVCRLLLEKKKKNISSNTVTPVQMSVRSYQ